MKEQYKHVALIALNRALPDKWGQARMAKLIGIKQQSVSKWRRFGVPPLRVGQVSKVSGIPRHRLRPDIYNER